MIFRLDCKLVLWCMLLIWYLSNSYLYCHLFHADIGLLLLKLYVNSLCSETFWYTEIETMKSTPGGSEREGGRGGKAGRQVQGDVLPRWPLLSDTSQETQLVTHQAFQLGHERCLQRRCTKKPRLWTGHGREGTFLWGSCCVLLMVVGEITHLHFWVQSLGSLSKCREATSQAVQCPGMVGGALSGSLRWPRVLGTVRPREPQETLRLFNPGIFLYLFIYIYYYIYKIIYIIIYNLS